MLPLNESILICLAFIVYYLGFQAFSNFVRSGMKTNTPNRTIEHLRTKYKININTFQKNNTLYGFAWFNSIWINENRFKDIKKLLSTFYHEKYHYDNKHKAWILTMRFGISLIPLLFTWIHWAFVLAIFVACALIIQYITDSFEKKANDYAKKMMVDEQHVSAKRD